MCVFFGSFPCFRQLSIFGTEFPPRNALPQRRYCNPSLCALCALPDDFCWLFCSLELYTPSSSLAAVDLPVEVHVGSLVGERGRLWVDDQGHIARRTD